MDAALVTGIIGVVGTLAGVGFTQWRSDVREQKRLEVEERREQTRLDRETEREQAARLFAHRQAAYASVVEQHHHWSGVGTDVRNGLGQAPPEDALEDFWRLVTEVRLIGGPGVGKAAQDLYFKVYDFVHLTPLGLKDPEDPGWDVHDAMENFLEAARIDLGVAKRGPRPNPEHSAFVPLPVEDREAPPEPSA